MSANKKNNAYELPFLIGVPKGIRTPVAAVKGQCPRPLDDGDVCFGGARRDRTADLLHAMQALSQLSYSPRLKMAILRAKPPFVKGGASMFAKQNISWHLGINCASAFGNVTNLSDTNLGVPTDSRRI